VDVDVVPVRERTNELLVRLGIGLGEVVEGGVGEHHAEPEGVVGPVALHHRDVVGGIRLLHEEGEVEAGRPAADADDLHAKKCTGTPDCPASVETGVPHLGGV
jgi:hypothetical protein